VKITTLLDIAGLLLMLLAAAVAVGVLWFIPAGIFIFGLGLLGISWQIDHAGKRLKK
jgi:hypothetical protein